LHNAHDDAGDTGTNSAIFIVIINIIIIIFTLPAQVSQWATREGFSCST
jgi:hypothetical protein